MSAPEAKQAFNKVQAAVLSVFASDAFALSYHWVYDVPSIPRPIEAKLHEPASKFHKEKGKAKGDFTHIGDQILLLLRQLKENKDHQYDPQAYTAKFAELFNENYKGWLTGYTKNVLQQIKDKVPADKITTAIGDTDPIGRIAPLFLFYKTEQELTPVAKQYVSFTNNTPSVMAATEFVSAVTFAVLGGKAPVAAIEELVKQEPHSKSPFVVDAVKRGLESKGQDTTESIKAFGNSCDVEGGFPSTIHLIAKYESDLVKLNEANVGAGGDSSARGLIANLVVGAHLGEVPSYAKEMKYYDEILKLLQ